MRLCDEGAADSPAHLPTSSGGGDRSIRTFFLQRCPACGRGLRTPIQLLGQRVDCVHCQGQFVAYPESASASSAENQEETILERADRLLAQLAGQRAG